MFWSQSAVSHNALAVSTSCLQHHFFGCTFSSGMKINIKGDHPATNGAALKGTVSGAAFAKRASAVDVEAVVASAVTTSPTTVNVGLSVPAYLAASGGSPTADNGQSMDAAACMEALSILSPDATTAPVIGTCTMLDATDTVGKSELVITYTTYPGKSSSPIALAFNHPLTATCSPVPSLPFRCTMP